MYQSETLETFLKAHEVGKGESFTHTKLSNNGRSYNIKDDEYNLFLNKYKEALTNPTIRKRLHITEKQTDREAGPFLIDIDYETDCKYRNERLYLDTHIKSLVDIVNNLINEYINIKEYEVFVLEKENPTEYTMKQKCKDGFHIIYPIAMDLDTRYFLYHELKKRAKEAKVFDDIDMLHKDYDTIFDISVINRNCWLMYGSRKDINTNQLTNPGIYELTEIYNEKGTVIKHDKYTEDEMVLMTAIRLYKKEDCHETKITEKQITEIQKIYNTKKKPKQKVLQQKEEKKIPNDIDLKDDSDDELYEEKQEYGNKQKDDINMAKKLSAILSKKRATAYQDWIRVGWALKNIDKSLLPEFKAFSKKCPEKYNESDCERTWHKAREASGYKLASLHWWARTDNKSKYLGVLRDSFNKLIKEGETGSHTDIAKIMYVFYGNIYKCTASRDKWFEFKNHRWQHVEGGYTLENRISDELTTEFAKRASGYLSSIDNENGIQKDNTVKKTTNINKVLEKLKDINYSSAIMRACKNRFIDANFEEKLDTNVDLLGFDNGVYDLKEGMFREGLPEDNIQMSVNYNYKEYKEDDAEVKEVFNFFEKVQVEPIMRDYILSLCSSFLDGHVRDQKFYIWTGKGCHTKGTLIKMYDGSNKKVEKIKLGEYLMGDDGRHRHVKVLFEGTGEMYKVYYNNTYIKVNAQHRLAVKNTYKTEAYTDKNLFDKTIYMIKWFEDVDGFILEKEESFLTKEKADSYIKTLSKKSHYIQVGEIMPITVENMYHKKDIRKEFKMFDTDKEYEITKIEKDGPGKYYGFEIDGNNRYIMGNNLVTYNSNGKSKTINLITNAFGDYYDELPVAQLTVKRKDASGATPELADKVGKRILTMSEPEEGEKIYVGQMKQYTGGDSIKARALYGNPFKFKPQFKLLLQCNEPPEVSATDHGTWRRLEVAEWKSTFVDIIDPKNPYEFKKDYDLDEKLIKWKAAFIWVLINKYYPTYRKNKKLPVPDCVKKHTDEYREINDMYGGFFKTEVKLTGIKTDKMDITDLYRLFQDWCQTNNTGTQAPNLKKFKAYIKQKITGITIKGNSMTGIKDKETEIKDKDKEINSNTIKPTHTNVVANDCV